MKTHHLLIALLCGAMPMWYSCSSEDLPQANDDEGVTLTLSLGVASNGAPVSRATQHKQESARDGEKAVNDVTVIIYNRPLNSAASLGGQIVKVLKASSIGTQRATTEILDPSYYISYYPYSDVLNTVPVGQAKAEVFYDGVRFDNINVNDLEIGLRYYAMAFVNFGNDLVNDPNLQPGEPLQALRDFVYKGDLYDPTYESGTTVHDLGAYTNFKMSAINEVSFIWQVNGGKVDLSSMAESRSRFLVQRLAARLDVGFGTLNEDFSMPTNGDYANCVLLSVFSSELSTQDNLVKLEDCKFMITDFELVNDRESASGTYLLERSVGQASGAPIIYLDNEGWDPTDINYATKTVVAAPSPTYTSGYRSLIQSSGRPVQNTSVSPFIFSGFLGDDVNASTIGYMTENVSTNSYTKLRITGYTDANTSSIFQTKSRSLDNYVTAEIPIYHSLPANHHELNPMERGVVRNTIYRIQIRVYASSGKIFFRYYYYGNLDTKLPTSEYSATGFQAKVEEGGGSGAIYPND